MKMPRLCLFSLMLILILTSFGQPARADWALASTPAPAASLAGAVVQAAGRGNPWLNLRDGATLPAVAAATFEGAGSKTQPLSLAAGDFDGDGVPDLLAGYATADGAGILSLHRGNVDALWPDTAEAQARRAAGTFVDAPFLPQAGVFALPAPPDFLGAGDFDGDGQWDVVFAARGVAALILLSGDGEGGFAPAESLPLPGGVTALTVGDLNRRDGLNEVAVGVTSATGPAALVFEGARGAWRATPEVFPVNAPVSGLAVGQLDEHYAIDLAVGAGNNLYLIHGRDRNLTLDAAAQAAVAPARVERHTLPFTVAALAVGDFVTEAAYRLEVALLAQEGSVHILDGRSFVETARIAAAGDLAAARSPQLVRANISSRQADDLVVVDAATRQVGVVMLAQADAAPQTVGLAVAAAPVAVLPMRLNVDGLDDLVLLAEGPDGLAVSLTAPMATWTVNSNAAGLYDTCAVGDGVCAATQYNSELGVCVVTHPGVCTLGLAVQEANAGAGMDTISIGITAINNSGASFNWPVTLLGNGAALNNSNILFQSGSHGSVAREFQFIGSELTMSGVNYCFVEGNTIQGQVTIYNGASHNTVGGTTTPARNVIAGSAASGVELRGVGAQSNVIQGNYIGVNSTGSAALANQWHGIYMQAGTANNTIGGTTPEARNVIAGNLRHGITLWGAYGSAQTTQGNLVQGNYIGTNAAGMAALPNVLDGINVYGYASNNTIGGVVTGTSNLISGNGIRGVIIAYNGASSNLVQGNLIGVASDGVTPLPNNSSGIYIGREFTFSQNTIGGVEEGAANVIAYNNGDGVTVRGGLSTAILGNLIYANVKRGIELGNDGAEPNDPGDGDSGANRLQNYPVLLGAANAPGGTWVRGEISSKPNTTYRVEFFGNTQCDPSGYGEGEMPLGAVNATTDAGGVVRFSATLPETVGSYYYLAATATDPDNNTSEFSACAGLLVNSTGDRSDANLSDGLCDTGFTITRGAQTEPECTLRAAIQQANARAGADTIYFDIPTAGLQSAGPVIRPQSALPAITSLARLDGSTQPGEAVVIEGSQAGDANGLRFTTSGSTMRRLTISGFSRSGIETDATFEIYDVTASGNGEFGVRAVGELTVSGANNLITQNGADGLFAGSISGAGSIKVNGNGTARTQDECLDGDGAGIFARGSITLGAVEAVGNCGYGIYAYNMNVTINGNARVTGNTHVGIRGQTGVVLNGSSHDISTNGWTGIESWNLGQVRITGDAKINGNGTKATQDECLSGDVTGIFARGGITTNALEAVGNCGYGLYAQGGNVAINGNARVANSGLHGILAMGNVYLTGSTHELSQNGRMAIFATGGMRINGLARVIGNGADYTADECHSYGPAALLAQYNIVLQNVLATGNCGAGVLARGQLVVQGRAEAHMNQYAGLAGEMGILLQNAGHEISNNEGPGLVVRYSGQRLVAAGPIFVTYNGGSGIVAPNVALNGGEVSHNQRYGIVIEGGEALVNAVSVYSNTLGGYKYNLDPVPWTAAVHAAQNSRIYGGQITANGGDGIAWAGGGLTLSHSNLSGNTGAALTHTAGAVDARQNWWGHASGPGGIGPGSGDEISGTATFEPWLAQPAALIVSPGAEQVLAGRGATAANPVFVQHWGVLSDTVAVTLSDAQGWLDGPTTFTTTLAGALGATFPLSFTVPLSAALDARDAVTVTVASESAPSLSAQASFQVVSGLMADLTLTNAASPPWAQPGERITYTLAITNTGPDPASGVVLSDTLPTAAALVAATPSQGSCVDAAPVRCTLGDVSPAASATVTVVVTLNATGVSINWAEVAANEPDPTPWNNGAAAGMEIIQEQTYNVYLPLVLRGAP